MEIKELKAFRVDSRNDFVPVEIKAKRLGAKRLEGRNVSEPL